MQAQLGKDYPVFAVALDEPPPTSIRYNSRKPYAPTLIAETPVPWHPRGAYLSERPVFTLDPAFHAGAYYVQEAASMFVAEAYRQLRSRLGDGPVRVLDMCAAPGGKSTALLDELADDDLLVANEVIQNRAGILRYNLTKWGRANVAVTNHDPADFAALAGFFDCILVDAPCSGEGLFRRDPAARAEWSPAAVAHCSARQQRILTDTLPLLREGGILLYSTCTYNAAENERAVAALLNTGFTHLPLAIDPVWGITPRNMGYQFYPHRTRSEGFYLAALQRTDGGTSFASRHRNLTHLAPLSRKAAAGLRAQLPLEKDIYQSKDGQLRYLPAALQTDWLALDGVLRRKTFGLRLGELKREQLIPDAALALAVDLPNGSFPTAAVDRETALRYLRGEAVELPDAPLGWVLLQYMGLGLGWAKKLAKRTNNYYPKGWRIRMR